LRTTQEQEQENEHNITYLRSVREYTTADIALGAPTAKESPSELVATLVPKRGSEHDVSIKAGGVNCWNVVAIVMMIMMVSYPSLATSYNHKFHQTYPSQLFDDRRRHDQHRHYRRELLCLKNDDTKW
jgi:hypothetical protein